MNEDLRARVVEVALSWVGTPYNHRQMVKGAGVDCATLLIGVFSEAGVIASFDPGFYPVEWHLHRTEELYLRQLEKYADYIDTPPVPSDIVVFKFGRTHPHAGIMVGHDRFVHAWMRDGKAQIQVWNPYWQKHHGKTMRAKGL